MLTRTFSETFEEISRTLSGVRAVFVIGSDGTVYESMRFDPTLDLDTLASEHSVLLRIARQSTEDSGTGTLTELMITTGDFALISRALSDDLDIVAVVAADEPLGRARFALRQALPHLEAKAHVR